MIEADGFPYRVASRTEREPQEVVDRGKEAYREIGWEPRASAMDHNGTAAPDTSEAGQFTRVTFRTGDV